MSANMPTDSGALASADPLGDEIATLCAHINAATYRLLRLLKTYDEEGRWQGFRSCAHWLSWRTGISLGPAREKVRVARCLPDLPLISEALSKGKLSYSKARALTRMATPGNEEELLSFADHGTTAHVEKLVRDARRVDRSQDAQADRAERRRLYLYPAEDGNYIIRGRLSPEVGSLLLKTLEVAEEKLYREQREAGTEHRTTATQRRADALGLWLDEQVQPQVQLVVHSFEGGGETAMGNLVLLCPLHHRAVHEGGWSVEVADGGVLRFRNPLGGEMPLAPKAPDIGGLLPGGNGVGTRPQDFGLAHWHERTDISPWTGSTLRHGERIDWGWALEWFCSEPGEGEGGREGGDAGRDRAGAAEAR